MLDFIKPTSIVALPDSNSVIVHCDTALFSYPLDLFIRVSLGDAAVQELNHSTERLAQKDGNVLFCKAGRVANRTLGKPSNSAGQHQLFISNSCLCNEELREQYVEYIRSNSLERESQRNIIPVFWFCESPLSS